MNANVEDYKKRPWKNLRLKIFKRDSFKCTHCESKKEIQCHHTYYINNRKLWDYPLDCFRTLCKDCHEDYHKKVTLTSLIRPEKNKRRKKENNTVRIDLNFLVSKLSEKDKAIQKRYDKLK